MKQYFIQILIVLVLISGLVMGCAQEVAPTRPDKPVYTEEETIGILKKHLEGDWWATPIFPVDMWTASYAGDSLWLVKAYNVDESYMGTWSVKELSISELEEGLSNEIKPYDEAAGAPKNLMPPLPKSLSFKSRTGYFVPNRETLIMAVQQHIASMTYQEAKEEGIQDTWEAIRSYYPIDWKITYTDTTWVLTGIECRAYVDAHSGQIDAHYAFTDPSW